MTIAHDVAGEGPAVLLLHAWVCDRRMWDPQWEELTRRYRVVRCDLRGFGATPCGTEPYRNTDDVVELLDSLGIGRVAVVGSSGGGQVALNLAALHPARVSALALLCTATPGYAPTPDVIAFQTEERRLLEAGDVDAAVELNVRTFLGPDASEEARAAVRTMQRRAFDLQLAATEDFDQGEREADLATITAPTLILSGARDLDRFRTIATDLANTLPQATHTQLPWAAHLPNLERPTELTHLLLDFLIRHGWSRPFQAERRLTTPWPEGPKADQTAAEERYQADLWPERVTLREAVRADLPAAHVGLGVVIVASAIVAWLATPIAGGSVAGGFAALFLVTRTVMRLRGIRGADAWRRSYLFAFGWANWI